MCDCLCFNGAPVDEDPRIHFNLRQWETSMLNSCCNQPFGCCLSMLCPCCMVIHIRRRALQYDMSRYSCCQGLICASCFECCPTENCPCFCLVLEALLFESCALSATRIYVQEERQIVTDPCDNRIIRFNNLMQLLSCICNILAIFFDELRLIAQIIDLIADIVYCLTQACMQAQTYHELVLHPTPGDYDGVTTTTVVTQPYGNPKSQYPPSY
eukprot:m.58179 g.58179  ORF g.58179 m.58179 type:complete len:213 (-) comp11247_c0_seq1:132-770(-)